MAAFQQLGPFISTFAEEKISENEDSSCLLSESHADTPKIMPKPKESSTTEEKTKDQIDCEATEAAGEWVAGQILGEQILLKKKKMDKIWIFAYRFEIVSRIQIYNLF